MKPTIPIAAFRKAFPVLLALCCLAPFQGCIPSQAKNTEHQASPYLGQEAPAFELPDHTGKQYSSEQLKGKFVVLHIATTWCPFCNAEAPNLEKLFQEYKSRGVEVLIIDVKEAEALVKEKLVDKFGLTFPVLMDTDGSVAARFAPPGVLPDLSRDDVMLASNLLIDPQGRIQFFSLLDSANFDAQLIDLKSKLNELL